VTRARRKESSRAAAIVCRPHDMRIFGVVANKPHYGAAIEARLRYSDSWLALQVNIACGTTDTDIR